MIKPTNIEPSAGKPFITFTSYYLTAFIYLSERQRSTTKRKQLEDDEGIWIVLACGFFVFVTNSIES